jgi:hypothetical protein
MFPVWSVTYVPGLYPLKSNNGIKLVALGFAIIAFTTATACSRPKTETLNEAGKHGTSPGLAGVWRSYGYGFVFVGNGDTIQIYEVTQTTCVPTAKKLTRRADTVPHAEAVYVDGYRVFLLRATPDSNEKRLQMDGTASDMVIHRIASRPATCDQPTPNTPEGNFEGDQGDLFARLRPRALPLPRRRARKSERGGKARAEGRARRLGEGARAARDSDEAAGDVSAGALTPLPFNADNP